MIKQLTIALTISFQMLLCAFGETTTLNGLTWYYTVSNNKIILGCESNRAVPETTSGAITIPSSISGKTVVEIGGHAFEGCTGLTSVTIPSTITNIADYAFYECTGLTSITIPSNVKCIGEGAFEFCSSLTSVSINGNNTFIGDYAFTCCTKLTDVTIPIGLKGMSPSAFCTELASVELQTPFALRLEAVKTVVASRLLSGDLSLETPNPRYNLTQAQEDRAIASITINANTTLSNFSVSNGKVYDTVIRIINTSANEVRVTLPSGYTYETLKGAKPLSIPPNSKNLLTITRVAADTFFVSRRELETVQ